MLSSRRDQEASFSIHNQNPMITDISDTNRPTKVAEQFSALYDNEWTDAFDAIARLEGKKANIEKEIIIYLDDVLRVVIIFFHLNSNVLIHEKAFFTVAGGLSVQIGN